MPIGSDQGEDGGRTLEDAFARLADAPPDRRRSLLDAFASSMPELAEELRDLLDAHDWLHVRDGLLGIVDGDVVATRLLRETGLAPGDRVGRYLVEAAVGRGSTADVVRARAADGAVSRVAIKVLRPGLASRDALARFEDERDLIASLDHPCIAPIVDAGRLGDGRPWFAMPFVDGRPLTEFCDAHRCDVQTRLALLLRVAEAVAYAHRRGVVHRDLKPDNILVRRTAECGDPLPTILDFGVARAIGGPRRADSLLELHRRILGTPAYMAPEQTRPGYPAGPAADVFALGGILCELLAGSPALALDDDETIGLDELFRRIREEPRPALRTLLLARGHERRIELARLRGTTPKGLLRLLKEEPSWIARRSLELDPDLRYESAGAMADDLRSALAGRPLRVDPRDGVRRTLLWLRRHRVGVAVAAVIVAAAGAGVVATALQAKRAQRAEQATRRQYEVVVAMAEQLVRELPDALWALPRQTASRRALLDSGVATLRQAVDATPEDPRVRRLLATGLGSLARVLGDPRQPSEGEFERSLAIAREACAEWRALEESGQPLGADDREAWAQAVLCGANVLAVLDDEEAIAWYEEAAGRFAALLDDPAGSPGSRGLVGFCHRIIAIMIGRRDRELGLEAARRGERAISELAPPGDDAMSRYGQATAEQSIAEAYVALGSAADARRLSDRAYAGFASIPPDALRPGERLMCLASTERYRAEIEALDGNLDETVRFADLAFTRYADAIAEADGEAYALGPSLQGRMFAAGVAADRLEAAGDRSRALDYAMRACDAARARASVDPDLPGPKEGLAEALLRAARIGGDGEAVAAAIAEARSLLASLGEETPRRASLRREAARLLGEE